MKPAPEIVRVDRWLMAARFYKTRSQAAKACEGRKVKVDGQTAKPHKTIRVGDTLTIHHKGRYRTIEILGLAERGLPPAVARELYHEEQAMTVSEEDKELMRMIRNAERKNQPDFKGRPTKRIRRKLDSFKDKLFGSE
ncbi:RNA-binding S4 domain-containing protein [candidate division KSB1 bacterium]|nr:RNA-binding S4 domain-containing protein [candidate division KSB1 bacterium]